MPPSVLFHENAAGSLPGSTEPVPVPIVVHALTPMPAHTSAVNAAPRAPARVIVSNMAAPLREQLGAELRVLQGFEVSLPHFRRRLDGAAVLREGLKAARVVIPIVASAEPLVRRFCVCARRNHQRRR